MNGIDRRTGKRVSGTARLRQSIEDILTTPVGSRVMRRDYGSRLHELVDAPLTSETLLRLFAATAEALAKWEPELRLTRVSVASGTAGTVALDVVGYYLPSGDEIRLEGIVIA